MPGADDVKVWIFVSQITHLIELKPHGVSIVLTNGAWFRVDGAGVLTEVQRLIETRGRVMFPIAVSSRGNIHDRDIHPQFGDA